MIKWSRTGDGYEVSTRGDPRFSAFKAMMPDGRSIEQWYQCDVKGYDPGGHNWRLGKGRPPLITFNREQLYELYLSLWRLWALRHPRLIEDLNIIAIQNNHLLTDGFATSDINQARALAQILNEWF